MVSTPHDRQAATDDAIHCPCCGSAITEAEEHAAYRWFRKRRRGLTLAGVVSIAVGATWVIATGDLTLSMLMLGLANGISAGIVVFVPNRLLRRPTRTQGAATGDPAAARD